MADPQAHADAAYEPRAVYERLALRIDSLADRVVRLEEPMLYSNRQRLQALEKEVTELKERITTTYPVPSVDSTVEWREYVVAYDPDRHNEWPWEEALVSLGVLYGEYMGHEFDQIKKTLARIVSICEYMEQRQMVPGDIDPIQKHAKALYAHFQPEGTDEEAVTDPWCYGELGDLAASWLRSLYA